MSDKLPSWYKPDDFVLGTFIEEEIKKAYAALDRAKENALSIKNDSSKEVYLYNIKAVRDAIKGSSVYD